MNETIADVLGPTRDEVLEPLRVELEEFNRFYRAVEGMLAAAGRALHLAELRYAEGLEETLDTDDPRMENLQERILLLRMAEERERDAREDDLLCPLSVGFTPDGGCVAHLPAKKDPR